LPSQADSGKILLPFSRRPTDSGVPTAISDLLRLCDSMFFVSSASFEPFATSQPKIFFVWIVDKNRIGISLDF